MSVLVPIPHHADSVTWKFKDGIGVTVTAHPTRPNEVVLDVFREFVTRAPLESEEGPIWNEEVAE